MELRADNIVAFGFVVTVAFFNFCLDLYAQVPPSAEEIATYQDLHKAAHDDDIRELERLILAGADIEVRDSHGRTPVHVAAYASSDNALTALAAAGADMNALEQQFYDVVTIASVADDPELVSLAIELGNRPDLVTSPYRGTALIAAAHLGHVEVVRRLIVGGAPLDHVNNLGWTALIEAIILGDGGPNHVATVKALIEAGADQMIADHEGVLPIAHAKARGYGEIIEILESAKK